MNGDADGDYLLKERQLALAEGVGAAENLPFFLAPDGAGAAVLLVHGFSATPWEMRSLAEHLCARGYACLAVRLPGHGTTPEDLAKRRWEEWLACAADGYDHLAGRFARVYAAGLSTGALLLLALARVRRPRPRGPAAARRDSVDRLPSGTGRRDRRRTGRNVGSTPGRPAAGPCRGG